MKRLSSGNSTDSPNFRSLLSRDSASHHLFFSMKLETEWLPLLQSHGCTCFSGPRFLRCGTMKRDR